MEKLREYAKKRKELGEKPAPKNGGNYNEYMEYHRMGELIIKEVMRMYDAGELH